MAERSDWGAEYDVESFEVFGGLWTNQNAANIPQNPKKPIGFPQVNNVYAPGDTYALKTIPGFSDVRADAINAAGIITGLCDMNEVAAKFLITCSIAGDDHSIYVDDASPPSEIAGGTDFTIGEDNLIDASLFTDSNSVWGAVLCSLLQDVPQFVNSSGTRANLSITDGANSLKPRFTEVLANRLLCCAPDIGGTDYDDRIYWSDIRGGIGATANTIDITNIASQFQSFETWLKDRVRAAKAFSSVCLVGKRHEVFMFPPSESAYGAFATPKPLLSGYNIGPVGNNSMIVVGDKCFWLSWADIYSVNEGGSLKSWANHIKPTITGFADADREYSVAGYNEDDGIILWAVTPNGGTSRTKILGLNIFNGALYTWDWTVNMMATRLVNGDPRLIGGGKVGKIRNLFDGTTGSADDASAVIDADVYTPRHNMRMPGYYKVFAGVTVEFDPVGTSAAVTVQYRLDDDSDWSSFSASPYTVTGTDKNEKFFPLFKEGTHLQLRFRDTISGEVMLVTRYKIHYKVTRPVLIGA